MSVSACEVEGLARQATAANWRLRNVRAVDDDARHEAMKRKRRHRLREWIAVIRISADVGNLGFIEDRLRYCGPLMGHDLRNRVILAGMDRILSVAHCNA